MNSHLTPQEIDLIKELFNMGFASAADSLSNMTHCKVLTQKIVLDQVDEIRKAHIGMGSKRKVNIFTSEIKGDLSGMSYWIVGQRDTNRLTKFIMSADIQKKPLAVRKEMQRAIMLEIDNVITAAVVTRMANLLGRMIYGNVPQHANVTRKELAGFIEESAQNVNPQIHVHTRYMVVDHAIQMEFHWFLPAAFGQLLRELHSREGRRALMEKAI